MDFRGFDSNKLLVLRGGNSHVHGNFLEILSQAILAGIILVGRSGVHIEHAGPFTLQLAPPVFPPRSRGLVHMASRYRVRGQGKPGRGDATVGNPHRAQIQQFELFELILLMKLDKQFPVEQFEATVSRSTVPSTPLNSTRAGKQLKRVGPRKPAEPKVKSLERDKYIVARDYSLLYMAECQEWVDVIES